MQGNGKPNSAPPGLPQAIQQQNRRSSAPDGMTFGLGVRSRSSADSSSDVDEANYGRPGTAKSPRPSPLSSSAPGHDPSEDNNDEDDEETDICDIDETGSDDMAVTDFGLYPPSSLSLSSSASPVIASSTSRPELIDLSGSPSVSSSSRPELIDLSGSPSVSPSNQQVLQPQAQIGESIALSITAHRSSLSEDLPTTSSTINSKVIDLIESSSARSTTELVSLPSPVGSQKPFKLTVLGPATPASQSRYMINGVTTLAACISHIRSDVVSKIVDPLYDVAMQHSLSEMIDHIGKNPDFFQPLACIGLTSFPNDQREGGGYAFITEVVTSILSGETTMALGLNLHASVIDDQANCSTTLKFWRNVKNFAVARGQGKGRHFIIFECFWLRFWDTYGFASYIYVFRKIVTLMMIGNLAAMNRLTQATMQWNASVSASSSSSSSARAPRIASSTAFALTKSIADIFPAKFFHVIPSIVSKAMLTYHTLHLIKYGLTRQMTDYALGDEASVLFFSSPKVNEYTQRAKACAISSSSKKKQEIADAITFLGVHGIDVKNYPGSAALLIASLKKQELSSSVSSSSVAVSKSSGAFAYWQNIVDSGIDLTGKLFGRLSRKSFPPLVPSWVVQTCNYCPCRLAGCHVTVQSLGTAAGNNSICVYAYCFGCGKQTTVSIAGWRSEEGKAYLASCAAAIGITNYANWYKEVTVPSILGSGGLNDDKPREC